MSTTRDWKSIFSNIQPGLLEAGLEQIFVQPLLEELNFYAPNNQQKDKEWSAKLDGQPLKVKPDYTCWKTDDQSVPPLLVVEDKKVHPSQLNDAIQQVQIQMRVTSATFGLATNGLEYQLWQRHGKVCVPRTVVSPLSVETIENTIETLKNILAKPKTALTVMFWNEKGGIGKTTITANVAAALALKSKKILVINLDFQGDLNAAFGLEPRLEYRPFITLEEVFQKVSANEPVEINQLIRTKHFKIRSSTFLQQQLVECALDIIPGDYSFEMILESWSQQGVDVVKRFIDQQAAYTYDYILLDVAPSLRDLGIAGVVAADFLCPIVDNQGFAVDATLRVLKTLESNMIIKELSVPVPVVNSIVFNPRLQTVGTVKSARAKVEEKLKSLNINYQIYALNNYVEIDNAAATGLPVVFHKPGSKSAATFNDLVRSIFGVE